MKKLSREFYERDGLAVAKELLGKTLVHESSEGRTSGIIVEVEAYLGPGDAAAHTYKNLRSNRTQVIHGPGGFSYVYLIYGMYNCFNVVANITGRPEALLIRAIEPVEGIQLMTLRRNPADKNIRNLCSGPGKLCQAMGITRILNGIDLCGDILYVLNAPIIADTEIMTTPRINIDYAGEAVHYPWRYLIKNNPFVSRKK
ncbi:MAG: DNA-3-methyladenine glycosylase [Eubacteriales bacterium]|nr:DNA-3-methyladenine glycosylase [Eubacteriales bacterium]MDD3198805.1 DNA-3-methyladenine glycosylase [Eubacteriales bacterium]MDD4121950.1 DNA-3-methyladenine glycosylase [Eubacteriales bacterium]MDD4629755.1 DNA-3-methyladenine glycosylase [Eubacteriales bacterium]